MRLDLFLAAIALVESGNNPNLIGSHGERSRYQITRTVWKQHAWKWDFETKAHLPFHSTQVASAHIHWLIKKGVPEDPLRLACAWNSGLSRYKHFTRHGGFSPSQAAICYSQRVANTYADLLKKEKAKR